MPNRTIYHATLTPGDTYFNRLWGLHNIHQNVNGTIGTDDADIDATEALDIITGSTGSDTVVIAVIDSGVKWDHEDLVGNIWSNPGEALNGGDTDGNGYVDDIRGWDFVDNDNDPMDYNGHGTHVAGTIASVGNKCGTGVCWTAKIMPLRGLNAEASEPTTNLILAIKYANANGAHVINNSWGGGDNSSWSNEDNATTLTAEAPSGLTATAVSASQINLTWTDNSNVETGFRIERKTGVGGTYAEIGSVGLDVVTAIQD